MNKKDELSKLESDSEVVSIGRVLKNRRESLKITQLEVASYLKVKVQDIDAIEEDDVSKITSHLYIPGLIRSYAKFLRVDPEVIEERAKKIKLKSNIDNKEHKLINIGEEQKLTPTRDSFFNFSLISILLFLVLLSVYNFYNNKSSLISNQKLISELENIN